MTREELYSFLNENNFVKVRSFGTSTGFGFTETYVFSRDNYTIEVCECDKEKTVINIGTEGTYKKLLNNTNLNSISLEGLKQYLEAHDEQ